MTYLLKNIFIFILSFYAVLWGTGWNIKYININVSEFFFPIIFLYLLLSLLFRSSNSFSINTILFVTLFSIILTIYSIIGYYNIRLPEHMQGDRIYLIQYSIKLFLFVIFAINLKELIRNKQDLNKFINYFFIILIPLYLFLHYKYMYVYETYHTGVSLDGSGLKNNKNAFGGMIALIYPFLFCTLMVKRKNIFYYMALFIIILSSLYLYSRSMIIVILFETILLFAFMLIRSKKNIIYILIFLSAATAICYNNVEEIKKYFLKSEYVGIDYIEKFESFEDKSRGPEYLFIDSHRGWLLHEAIIGGKSNYFLGNGLSTFRVRDSNYGSPTETHNDHANIFYETGILGSIFFFISFGIIFIKTIRIYLKRKENYYLASFTSMAGLILLMCFTNFINTFMFGIIIGLSISILNFKKN